MVKMHIHWSMHGNIMYLFNPRGVSNTASLGVYSSMYKYRKNNF